MSDAPPVPAETGRLDVGDGHELYWEAHGAPGGKPAVVLHGGPGSGAPPRWALLFDVIENEGHTGRDSLFAAVWTGDGPVF